VDAEKIEKLRAVFSMPPPERPAHPAAEAEEIEFIRASAAWGKQRQAAFDALQTQPEARALVKLRAGMTALKNDPEIAASEACNGLLKLLQDLLEHAWPHHDINQIFAPVKAHIDRERSKKALDEKRKKKDDERIRYYHFLDEQKDIHDTPRLAARLKKAFEIKTERVAEDEVRDWKKLRATGKTEGKSSEAPKTTGSDK
jgi:hypothetical protein